MFSFFFCDGNSHFFVFVIGKNVLDRFCERFCYLQRARVPLGILFRLDSWKNLMRLAKQAWSTAYILVHFYIKGFLRAQIPVLNFMCISRGTQSYRVKYFPYSASAYFSKSIAGAQMRYKLVFLV